MKPPTQREPGGACAHCPEVAEACASASALQCDKPYVRKRLKEHGHVLGSGGPIHRVALTQTFHYSIEVATVENELPNHTTGLIQTNEPHVWRQHHRRTINLSRNGLRGNI